jgi:hypothetical protein
MGLDAQLLARAGLEDWLMAQVRVRKEHGACDACAGRPFRLREIVKRLNVSRKFSSNTVLELVLLRSWLLSHCVAQRALNHGHSFS